MTVQVIDISDSERDKVLAFIEGHFGDIKDRRIGPGKLTNTISALSNAEGGEVYIGVHEDTTTKVRNWQGFPTPEGANAHLQVFEPLFPLGDGCSYTFLRHPSENGLVLKVEVGKSRDVKKASDGIVYIRRGAQNLQVTTEEALARLRLNKGLTSFESQTLPADLDTITNSAVVIDFMLEIVPEAEPEPFLRKQHLIHGDKPTVAGAVLFADEPQALLPKRSGIKLYRYKTTAAEGTRKTLAFQPISIEGHAYAQIREAVRRTVEIIEAVRVNRPGGLEAVKYPETAIHEIITNAVLHRDYSIEDDIHIVIYDNRVEVKSPGSLPAHITPSNILNQRFSRNPAIVRWIAKFPNPPNKDVGEGLNAAFDAMRDMKLKPPVIAQDGAYVTVTLRHERLAAPEEMILEYLRNRDQITNKVGRELCSIGSENKMKRLLQKLVKNGDIEPVPETSGASTAYRLRRK